MLARSREVCGVRVWLPFGTPERQDRVAAKVGRALELIAAHDARAFASLRDLSRGIFVADRPGVYGSWIPAPRIIVLSLSQLDSDSMFPEHVAATVVHEVAHAWLESKGLRYHPERRHRIEALCYLSEARFARRIPGGHALADHYSAVAARVRDAGPEQWSWEARVERDLAELDSLGTPEWVRRLVRRIALRRSA